MEGVSAVQIREGSVVDRAVNTRKAHIDSSSPSGCYMDELFTVVQVVFRNAPVIIFSLESGVIEFD